MRDFYIIVVGVVTVAHFAFIGYLAGGGFLALRWPRTIWLHVLVVLWGIGSVVLHFPCPLTSLERWAREHAGMGQLARGGFIEYYITGALYPFGLVGVVQALGFVVVGVSWVAFAAKRRRRSSAKSAE